MEQPQESTNESGPAATSLVVIAREERTVRSTVSFLNRRGIPTKIVTNMNEAIELLSAKQANMVLLSVNYPHPKIEIIPMLLLQSFQVDTILFAEDTERKSQQKLNGTKARLTLFGPVSGPIVLMRVRQIEKELVESMAKPEANDESMAKLLKTLTEDERPAAAAQSEGALERSGSMIIQKGVRSKMMSSIASGPTTKERRMAAADRTLKQAIGRGLSAVEATKKPKLLVPLPKEDLLDFADEFESGDQTTSSIVAPGATPSAKKQATSEGNSGEMKSAIQGGPAASSSSKRRPEPVKLRSAKTDQEERFLRCIREAMSTVCGEPIGVSGGLSSSSAAGLVTVRSQKMEGSFVIEVGRSKADPRSYLQRIEVAFFSIVRRMGIELGDGQQFAIEIEELEVVGKAVEKSDYKMLSSTADHEVLAAVVPLTQPAPDPEAHENNMAKLQVADLPVEVALTFDVYLYMKTSDRYLRYLKVGSKMSGDQSKRLTDNQVDHLFLNEEDREAYRRHYATHSLNQKTTKKSA